MNQPNLTLNIEKKLLSLIKAAEVKAQAEGGAVDVKLYLQLADLFHFDKRYKAEIAILERFSQLDNAVTEEMADIHDRIDRVSSLLNLSREVKTESAPLSLVEEIELDNVPQGMKVSNAVVPRTNQSKSPFAEKSLKILALSAAYTGTSDRDEIIQLAMVLFESSSQQMKKGKLLGSYWGQRKTRTAVPKKVANQFNFNLTDKDVSPFSRGAVLALIQQADMIVSHNEAEIERKLLATLIPEIVDIAWHSSERDIPWRAMGFDSNRLTQLAGQLDERAPRTCMDRAMIISRILQKNEPFSTQTYLERLYNMQPMKAFEWTPSLKKQSARLSQSGRGKFFWTVLSTLFLLVATFGFWYFSTQN